VEEFTLQVINGIVLASYYILAAIGLSLIYGVLGISHFAHGSLIMVGGYMTHLFATSLGVNYFLSILIAMVVVTVLGLVIEELAYKPVRHAPPINTFIIGLGLVMVIDNLATAIFGPDQIRVKTPLTSVFKIGFVNIASLRIFMVVGCAVLTIALIIFMKYAKIGKAIRATSQNSEASLIVGINTNKVYAIVFGMGSAYGAIAGSLIAALFSAYPTMGTFLTMKAFAVLILSGLGSIPGIVVGGLIIGLTESIGMMFLPSDYKDIFAFVIMIIVLFIKPSGLFGVKEGR
jgi:branched-chain amino acid transport system permease protein